MLIGKLSYFKVYFLFNEYFLLQNARLTYPVLSFKVTSRVNLSTRDEIKLNLS